MSHVITNVALAMTLHDPEGRLHSQIERVLPALRSKFSDLALCASASTMHRSLLEFSSLGAVVQDDVEPEKEGGSPGIGRSRRLAIGLALQSATTESIFYCDCDRILHWEEHFPTELDRVIAHLGNQDLLVMGRTERAFLTHPRPQRDTESIVNHVFRRVTGFAWDVTGAARGLSRRAAEAIVHGCLDDEISSDVSWPLRIRGLDGFILGYLEAEGLEFETADRFGDEVTKAGGLNRWLEQLDASPVEWEHRLELARTEIGALSAYSLDNSQY